MRSYLDFEKPVAEIEAKIEELRAVEAGDSAAAIGEEIARLEAKAAAGVARPLCRAHALAEDPGRAPSRAAALPRLCRRPDHRFRAARGRSQVRRRRRHRRRLRPLPRESDLRARPRKGLRHREPAQAQFRHGAPGGLPQGRAADGDGRPLRHPGPRHRRYRRRLSRGSVPRSAGRPRRSRARPKPASSSASPMWR